MVEILEAIRHTGYKNFSFHVVSDYQKAIYPRLANMTIDAYASIDHVDNCKEMRWRVEQSFKKEESWKKGF